MLHNNDSRVLAWTIAREGRDGTERGKQREILIPPRAMRSNGTEASHDRLDSHVLFLVRAADASFSKRCLNAPEGPARADRFFVVERGRRLPLWKCVSRPIPQNTGHALTHACAHFYRTIRNAACVVETYNDEKSRLRRRVDDTASILSRGCIQGRDTISFTL